MEPLGKKLQQARLAKKISLEEASRVTKIRAARIQEIEAEDFSNFSSLAYAKGFLLIYGKFLDVDVSPYLDAFATSPEHQAAADSLQPALAPLYRTLDPDTYGGAVLLGVDGVCIIGHGSSNALAIVNAIKVAREMVESDLVGSLRQAIS